MTDPLESEEDKKLRSYVTEVKQEAHSIRAPHKDQWTQTAEHLEPSRNFELSKQGNDLVSRHMVDTTMLTAWKRSSALIHGNLFEPNLPFLRPKLKRRAPDHAERQHLDEVQRVMERFHSDSDSTYQLSLGEVVGDWTGYGNGVWWLGRARPGARPFYRSISLAESAWLENDEGLVDCFVREYMRPLRRLMSRYGEKISRKMKAMASKDNGIAEVRLVSLCQPREYFPDHPDMPDSAFVEVVICEDTQEILDIERYEEFPYAVTRFNKKTGSVYGTGLGYLALPMARLLNWLLETVAECAEYATRPPLADWTGQMDAGLDLRAGAINSISVGEALMMPQGELLKKIYEGGDTGVAGQLIQDLRQQIEVVFYTDWMTLRDNARMTAEEVRERRDTRLRSLVPLVTRAEREMLHPMAGRIYRLLDEDRLFPDLPDSLDGQELTFEFVSHLASAMKLGRVDKFRRQMEILTLAAGVDERAVAAGDVVRMARAALEAVDTDASHLPSDEELEAMFEAQRREQETDTALDRAAAAAGAARDAGQAAASVGGGGRLRAVS